MSNKFFETVYNEEYKCYDIYPLVNVDYLVGVIWFHKEAKEWVLQRAESYLFSSSELQEILEFMRGLEGAEQ